jgi:hypothetical protein
MSFGKHQSFFLKKQWITKGINAIIRNPEVFFDKSGYLDLGIGKNMQQSLKFWLEVTNIARVNADHRYHELTDFGILVSKYDLGCSTKLSQNLIHFFISADSLLDKNEYSDSFFWFFNIYEERKFTKDASIEALVRFDSGNTSSNTIKRDIECLISTYTSKEQTHAEDKNVALLSELNLVTKIDYQLFSKTRITKDHLSFDAFYYILLVLKEKNIPLTIDNLVINKNGLGKTFNLNRVELIEIIEKMIRMGYKLNLVRTNNLDTITLQFVLGSAQFLSYIYEDVEL